MWQLLKKIFKSKTFRLVFSLVLIYFAFKKVDIVSLFRQLVGIKAWFLVLNILVTIGFSFLISYRWSLLLIKKPKWKDILNFAKSSLTASFYGLFLPTAAGSDVLKWIIIDEKYPEISKTKLLGSIILDRIVGLSTYMILGLVFVLGARAKGIMIPDLIFWVMVILVIGSIGFYLVIYFFDVNKIILRFSFLRRFLGVGELLTKENFGQIMKGVLLSVFCEFGWVLQLWFISWYFGAHLSIFSILVYIPIISMILILPISIAGFGAREQLYLFFFLKVGGVAEGILLTSAFGGILGIVNALIGGLITLTPDFKKINNRTTKKQE